MNMNRFTRGSATVWVIVIIIIVAAVAFYYYSQDGGTETGTTTSQMMEADASLTAMEDADDFGDEQSAAVIGATE